MEEFTEIPKDAKERLKDPEIIRRQLREGKTFQEIIGYDSLSMDKFYRIGCNLFEKQDYQEAMEAFSFLTTLNPYVPNYWLGLGMSEQMMGEYQGALLAYAMSILTEVENPYPHYHSASCYRQLGDYKSASHSLQLAIKSAGEIEMYAGIKEQAEKALEAVKKKLDE